LQKMEDLQLEVVAVNAEVFDNKLKATLKAKVSEINRSISTSACVLFSVNKGIHTDHRLNIVG